ncbi:MAG: hypothetical protein IIU04_00585 [Bacteroidales bacterium]|nr:hypothetical protein [Bacteroidales bacterium]
MRESLAKATEFVIFCIGRTTVFKIIVAVVVSALGMANAHAQEAVGKKQGHDSIHVIQMSSFTDIPDEIDGCACYFSVSQEDLKNGVYIFVNDFASLAFVKIINKTTCEDGSELMEGIITINMKDGTIKQKYIGKCEC